MIGGGSDARPWRGPTPPMISTIVLIAMFASHFLWPGAVLLPWPWDLVGVVALAAGLGLAVWAMICFVRAGAEARPFEDASVLVVDGPYRFTRNPMYLSIVVSLVGVALVMGTLTPWLGPVAMALWLDGFTRKEERHVRAALGADYEAYQARVRRWF
ncbi:methyltransferase family protein [Rhodospira trueperi]|uniref:Protein-S-isoprenylcysteine O-methyltransferase Ste14 n=1 Tax=Rhodospira trueperi TaxID=69960 RepID=A0A1G7E5B4_9PROT|nr:isoprenylcysteine carboxylmethyltransferase family protein [Rhodospira trueperi]SDE58656.1 Protein-S-isoprenylcysteine O-methyltransferase Ste14 [Rhodospira trueperi]